MAIKILHNPKCSKSRETLELLKKNGCDPEVVEYLKTPPTAKEISGILDMLGIEPRNLMRRKEDVYKANNLDDSSLSRDQLIEKMVDNPILIERPIVIANDKKAAIGRPPESVLSII